MRNRQQFIAGWALAFAMFLAASATSVFAQTTLGRISGVVRDQSGAAVAGAVVTVRNEGTNEKHTTTTSNLGSYTVPNLAAGLYNVRVEMKGFRVASYTQVKVDTGLEYSLNPVLAVGEISETVEVTAGADLVNTNSATVAETVVQQQILLLPIPNKDITNLIRLQAGVQGVANRTTTAINGGRPTWTQVTQDGVNIQDNYIRTNGLDFLPNRPTSDTVSEFSITTNNQGADAAGGSAQVKLTTPSGTNVFHGSLYEFNRNSALSANTWFNNHQGVDRPFLNQNQFGGRIGGPIVKNKLFIFGYYEGYRRRQSATPNIDIPAHDDYKDGVFRYISTNGTTQTVNVMTLVPGLSVDPQVKSTILDKLPSASLVNNQGQGVGNSTASVLLNTAGYRWNQSRATTRNYYGVRGDYEATSKHHFEFIYGRFRETDDRPDLDQINPKPKAFTDSPVNRYVGAWRFLINDRMQNEFRVGVQNAPVKFETTEDYPSYLFDFTAQQTNRLLGLSVRAPYITFLPQGRDTRTRQYSDNFSWVNGNHTMSMGGSLQQIRVQPFNAAGQYPIVTTGFSAAAPASLQLTAGNFPAPISATDLAAANNLRAFLGGVVSSVRQTFQVKDTESGYVAGIPQMRNYSIDNWAFYFQDNFRVKSNLTLNLGLKWEYFSPVAEDNAIALLPVAQGGSMRDTLLQQNVNIDYSRGGMWKPDRNNFAPSVGFAWDPFGEGKTAIRGGYTLAYVNEDGMTVANNAAANNSGLTTNSSLTNQFTTVNVGVPTVPTPTFKVPRTLADQMALSLGSAVYGIEPHMAQPKVHQISLGISRELPYDLGIEARYVSTMGRGLWRGIDLNQTNAPGNQAFVDDFLRARSNGYIALATPASTAGCTTTTCGVFNPAYNSNLPGSQPLSVLTTATFGGGSLTNTTVRTALQQNEVGRLADFYTAGNAGGAVAASTRSFFLPNPGIYVADLLYNGSATDYHGAQFELRRRMKNGLFGQVNYTFSKVLADTAGTTQARLETNLDNARPHLERARAEFDITHVVNANIMYELPLGRNKRWLNGGHPILDRIVGGWAVSSIIHWQGGSPFTITATRGTFNRVGRSTLNTPFTSLTRDQIKDLLGVRVLPNGTVTYFDPSIVGSDGRAVGPDNATNSAATTFNQVFFNPGAAQIGNMGRLQFDGPSVLSWDMAFTKTTRINERFNLEFRAEMLNFPNHPSFATGDGLNTSSAYDWDINNTTFGQINGVSVGARVVQLNLRLNF